MLTFLPIITTNSGLKVKTFEDSREGQEADRYWKGVNTFKKGNASSDFSLFFSFFPKGRPQSLPCMMGEGVQLKLRWKNFFFYWLEQSEDRWRPPQQLKCQERNIKYCV